MSSSHTAAPRITITYCTQCNWLLRSQWLAAELLNTFGTELGSVTLVPGSGGVFTIEADGELLWERRRDNGFPDAPTLKRLLRDAVLPDWNLGHGETPRG